VHDVAGPPADAQDQPPLVVRVTIKRHIRDMEPGLEGGGSDPKLLGDTEGRQWMVKPPNNPQGKRVLVNEYVAAAVGARIGALIQPGAVCLVPDELAGTMKLGSGAAWSPGEAFGSEFAVGTKPYLDTMRPEIKNRDELLGAIAIDTWLSLHDSRQARVRDAAGGGYEVLPVDFGHCIGPGNWGNLAARPPIAGLHDPNGWSIGASGPAAEAVANAISQVTEEDLSAIIGSIPDSWEVVPADRGALLTFLVDRRDGVVALIALTPPAP
jgi:hypothetical protein